MADSDQLHVPDGSHASSQALTEARDKTIYEAASEAGALANIFRGSLGQDGRSSQEFDSAVRGALLRIEALCTSVCLLQGENWRDNLAQEYSVVFGRRLEVAHG